MKPIRDRRNPTVARYDEKRQNAGEDYLEELQRDLLQQSENAVSRARKRADAMAEAIALTDYGVVLLVHGLRRAGDRTVGTGALRFSVIARTKQVSTMC